jgi:hypothetical protein
MLFDQLRKSRANHLPHPLLRTKHTVRGNVLAAGAVWLNNSKHLYLFQMTDFQGAMLEIRKEKRRARRRAEVQLTLELEILIRPLFYAIESFLKVLHRISDGETQIAFAEGSESRA